MYLSQEFPRLWDQFEEQMNLKFLEGFQAGELSPSAANLHPLSNLYDTVGWNYWKYSAAAAPWFQQFEEHFFESRYYEFEKKYYRYSELDAMVAERLSQLSGNAAPQVYTQILKTCMDARKQEIQKDLQYLENQLKEPVPYTLTLEDGKERLNLSLQFESAYRKDHHSTVFEKYAFTFHGRTYPNVSALREEEVMDLTKDISICKDAYGEQDLIIYTRIPTFDSGDWEWDSRILEFLIFDGQAINLVVLRGGYHIAHLTFYETLLSADCPLKAYFDKLGWPTKGIDWQEEQ